MRIAIVDDEPYWREKAQKVIEKCMGFNVPAIDAYVNGESFLHANEYYDLVFLDIEMDRIDGFYTTRKYKETYPDVYIIFLTTHTEFVTKGYEVSAFRYIYKDTMEIKIPEAMRDYQTVMEKARTIVLNIIGVGEVPVQIKNIISITMEKRNTLIHTKTKDFRCSAGMLELEEKLIPYGFFRTHKSSLINISEVADFDKRDIIMKDRSIAYMSKRKYAEFRAAYLDVKMQMSNG